MTSNECGDIMIDWNLDQGIYPPQVDRLKVHLTGFLSMSATFIVICMWYIKFDSHMKSRYGFCYPLILPLCSFIVVHI